VALLESTIVIALAFTVVMHTDFLPSPSDVCSHQTAEEETHHLAQNA